MEEATEVVADNCGRAGELVTHDLGIEVVADSGGRVVQVVTRVHGMEEVTEAVTVNGGRVGEAIISTEGVPVCWLPRRARETNQFLRRAPVLVLWDYDNVKAPKGENIATVVKRIRASIRRRGYDGGITIHAYCNTNDNIEKDREQLEHDDVHFFTVRVGVKDAADRLLLIDMFLAVKSLDAPVNIMIISGDHDFCEAVHLLANRGHNIMIVHGDGYSEMLLIPAKFTWKFKDLLAETETTLSWPEEVSYVFHALSELETEMILPTEANISEWIRCEMKLDDFNVQRSIQKGLEFQLLQSFTSKSSTSQGQLKLYRKSDVAVWQVVNHLEDDPYYPQVVWDTVKAFLISSTGREKMESTNSMHEAAACLRGCLEGFLMGHAYQLVHVLRKVRGWITPASEAEWSPLLVTMEHV